MSDPFPHTAADRLVLGLAPPATAAAEIADRIQALGPALRGERVRIAPDRLHLGLQGLGEHAGLRRDIVSMAAEAAGAVATPGDLEIRLDVVESRTNRNLNLDLVLASQEPQPALEAFHQALGLALARAGLGRHLDRAFQPHMVLACNVSGHRREPIAPVAWTARDFVLLHILPADTRQVALGRWPLARPVAADAGVQP